MFSTVAGLYSAACGSSTAATPAELSWTCMPTGSTRAPPRLPARTGSPFRSSARNPTISPTSALRQRPWRAFLLESQPPKMSVTGLMSNNARAFSGEASRTAR